MADPVDAQAKEAAMSIAIKGIAARVHRMGLITNLGAAKPSALSGLILAPPRSEAMLISLPESTGKRYNLLVGTAVVGHLANYVLEQLEFGFGSAPEGCLELLFARRRLRVSRVRRSAGTGLSGGRRA